MCDTQTNGVFNPAKNIIKKMKELEEQRGNESPENLGNSNEDSS